MLGLFAQPMCDLFVGCLLDISHHDDITGLVTQLRGGVEDLGGQLELRKGLEMPDYFFFVNFNCHNITVIFSHSYLNPNPGSMC